MKVLYERTRIMEEQRLVMENDLRKLGRMELLQVLLRVTESNEALMVENAELKSASSMQISRSAKVGSIAEEALRVNGFFEAAQRSADDYLNEIMKLRDEMIEHSKAQAAAQASRGVLGVSEEDQREQSRLFERIQDQAKTYIQDVQTYANNVIDRANSQAQAIVDDARLRSDEIIAQANDQARAIVKEVEARAALKDIPLVEDLEIEEVFEDEPAEFELPTKGFEAVELEAKDAEAAETQIEESEMTDLAAVITDTEESAVEGQNTVEPAAEDPAEEESEAFAPATEEPIDEVSEREEPLTEEAAIEESPGEVSQTTAPLNIDVIVSDIAAAAYSEDGLDPNSTGALVRRGRHVKLPEGMAM